MKPKTKMIVAISIAALIAIIGGIAYSKAVSKVPQDGANEKVMRFDNLYNLRYAEVFLIRGNGLTHNLDAAVYNTTDLNNSADKRDTCPQAMWDKVDPEALKKQFDVLGVFKNGPRYWMYDWIELPVGAQRDLDGLQARWFCQVNLPKNMNVQKKGGTAYKPTTVPPASKQGYLKGTKVFILDDPDGTPWIMQAYSHIVDPNLSLADLETLDNRLKLPPGWKYRVKVLDRDLTIIVANSGFAQIVQDDVEGTY